MHELGIALEIAERAVARAGDARVARIVVEIGALVAVLPDALRFAWDAVIEDSTLAGTTLEIVEIAGRGRCRACALEIALARPFGRCGCGNTDLELIAGEQLQIRSVEVHA
jgi:hydrogenase nickel incorporation protein HypA/HybF